MTKKSTPLARAIARIGYRVQILKKTVDEGGPTTMVAGWYLEDSKELLSLIQEYSDWIRHDQGG